ncbi:MAG: PASTA domain-containing protein [Bacteroidetes bacterium]|nr:PASTA domain-containing protein [Bacteroidota bacterium]
MIKGVFQFIKSKTFLKHLGIYLGVMILLILIITYWLNSTTKHGESIKVPDFNGVKLGDLDQFVADKKVRYLVIDSIYDLQSPKGVVVRQEPEANAEVKENRMIYLYVTSILPPSIEMPKLIDRSLRQATAMITSYGLKLNPAIKFVPDQCANCVLDQLVKGKRIAPGDIIEKGTVITLVVGKGLSDEEVGVPCLFGLGRKDAIQKLAESSLSIGVVTYDEPKDSAISVVYRQSPSCGKDNNVNMGATVDLYMTSDKNKVPAVSMPAEDAKNSDSEFDE